MSKVLLGRSLQHQVFLGLAIQPNVIHVANQANGFKVKRHQGITLQSIPADFFSSQLKIGADESHLINIVLPDMAIANNTVSSILDGPIARGISEQYKVDPRRTASLLDLFSCVMQGAIPYGAQILMVGSLTAGAASAFTVIPRLWYQMLLAVFAIVSIFVPFADGVLRKDPWNFEKWCPKSQEDKR